MSKRPAIPKRHFSLMPSAIRAELDRIKSRKVSARSTISVESSVSEFLEEKIQSIRDELDYTDKYWEGLKQAFEEKKMKEEEIRDALKELEESEDARKQELVIIKRQRKLVEEDIEEAELRLGLEEAYAQSMMNQVMATTSKQRKVKFDQSEFRKNVERYYDAVQVVDGSRMVYCPLTGWLLSKTAKAAHLVPKLLESAEIAYLFGADEVVLSEPRNGLILHGQLEEALDLCQIAIVPIPTSKNEPTRWKMLLTDESLRKQSALMCSKGLIRWGDLDEQELTFINDSRPARRYLYFRFIMTYMARKKDGATDWTKKGETKAALWTTPGPYLWKSMLQVLARQISHHYLPEALVEEMTFDDAVGCSSKPAAEEQILGMALSVRVNQDRREQVKRRESDDGNETESEADEGDIPAITATGLCNQDDGAGLVPNGRWARR